MIRFRRFITETSFTNYLGSLLIEAFSEKQIASINDKLGGDAADLIKQFDMLRSKNMTKGIDIASFKTKEELRKFIDSVPQSKSTVKATAKQEGSKLVFENDKVKVFLITSKEASCQYGSGTKWCITMKNQRHYETYVWKGVTFYFIIAKNPSKPDLAKVAVAKYPEKLKGVIEVFDTADKQLNNADYNEFFKENEIDPAIFKSVDTISEKEITKILNSSDDENKMFAIHHPNVTKEHIDMVLDDKDEFLRRDLFKRRDITKEHIDKALNDSEPIVRRAAIKHKNVTAEHIDKALNDEDSHVRSYAISQPNATAEHIKKALNDKEDFVRDRAKNLQLKRQTGMI